MRRFFQLLLLIPLSSKVRAEIDLDGCDSYRIIEPGKTFKLVVPPPHYPWRFPRWIMYRWCASSENGVRFRCENSDNTEVLKVTFCHRNKNYCLQLLRIVIRATYRIFLWSNFAMLLRTQVALVVMDRQLQGVLFIFRWNSRLFLHFQNGKCDFAFNIYPNSTSVPYEYCGGKFNVESFGKDLVVTLDAPIVPIFKCYVEAVEKIECNCKSKKISPQVSIII